MGKPDLQKVYVTPAGQPFRDDGEGGLEKAFENLLLAADDTAATNSGIAVGGMYIKTATGAVTRRLV